MYEHLDNDIKKLMSGTDSERIEKIRTSEWFAYDAAKEILQEMEMLISMPDSLRSPGLLITAPPNNGKTTLVHYFAAKHLEADREDRMKMNVPVILINSPHKPDIGWFLGNILLALNAPHRTNEKEEIKFNQVVGLCEELNVKLLIADEISDIVDGSALQQRHFFNMLKNLNNNLKRPIVLTGTPRIQSAISIDEQVNRRFAQRDLPEWIADLEFLNFLATFEKRTPIKCPSNLDSEENRMLALSILNKSNGRIGYLIELLRKAAEQAILTGKELIDQKIIDSIRLQK